MCRSLPEHLSGVREVLNIRRRKGTLDYRLCNQTVTVYHKAGGNVIRTVHTGAFLDFKKTENVDKTGSKEVNSFLLVIPCSEVCVQPEDKVLMGIGEEITTAQWPSFIPVKVPGLVVVKYVDPKYWNGKLIHVEAGG